MTAQQDLSVDVLNELHAAEVGSLLARVQDLGVFVAPGESDRADLMRRIVHDSSEHCEWLIEAIQQCDGAVWPVSMDPRTASLHYVSLDSILGQIAATVERLLTLYRTAAAHDLTPAALSVIGRITQRYSDDLAQLRRQQADHSAQPA